MFHKKIEDHFKKNDPLLHTVMKQVKSIRELEKEDEKLYFRHLCREIVGQQLAGAAAEKIFGRFEALFPKNGITPERVLKTPDEKLRGIGLSRSKAQYIKNIATSITDKKLRLHLLHTMTEDEVLKELTQIKGVGPWTAEMFLMFTLGRENVFSYGDYGLKKGMMKVYGFKKIPSPKQVEKLLKKWHPYKTYAALALWQSLEL